MKKPDERCDVIKAQRKNNRAAARRTLEAKETCHCNLFLQELDSNTSNTRVSFQLKILEEKEFKWKSTSKIIPTLL
jgi:hypothetical protein